MSTSEAMSTKPSYSVSSSKEYNGVRMSDFAIIGGGANASCNVNRPRNT